MQSDISANDGEQISSEEIEQGADYLQSHLLAYVAVYMICKYIEIDTVQLSQDLTRTGASHSGTFISDHLVPLQRLGLCEVTVPQMGSNRAEIRSTSLGKAALKMTAVRVVRSYRNQLGLRTLDLVVITRGKVSVQALRNSLPRGTKVLDILTLLQQVNLLFVREKHDVVLNTDDVLHTGNSFSCEVFLEAKKRRAVAMAG